METFWIFSSYRHTSKRNANNTLSRFVNNDVLSLAFSFYVTHLNNDLTSNFVSFSDIAQCQRSADTFYWARVYLLQSSPVNCSSLWNLKNIFYKFYSFKSQENRSSLGINIMITNIFWVQTAHTIRMGSKFKCSGLGLLGLYVNLKISLWVWVKTLNRHGRTVDCI